MSIIAMEETLFPVKEVPAVWMKHEKYKKKYVKSELQVNNGYKFIVREDTGDVLSCMSDEYKVVDNTSVIQSVNKVLKGTGAALQEAKTFSGGQRALWKWNFPKTEVKVNKNDIVNPQLIIQNSYDGTTSLNIMGGAFRLVCLNGLTIGNVLSNTKAVHKNNNTEIDRIESSINDTIKMLVNIFETEFPNLINTPLRTQSIVDTTKIIPSQYLEDFTRYVISNDMKTYWDLLNACTYVSTHTANRDRESLHIMESQIYPKITKMARA
jgi:hypothetical protein